MSSSSSVSAPSFHRLLTMLLAAAVGLLLFSASASAIEPEVPMNDPGSDGGSFSGGGSACGWTYLCNRDVPSGGGGGSQGFCSAEYSSCSSPTRFCWHSSFGEAIELRCMSLGASTTPDPAMPNPDPQGAGPCANLDNEACIRRVVGDAVRAALVRPSCAELAMGRLNRDNASPANLFHHLNVNNSIPSPGDPNADGSTTLANGERVSASAVASAPQNYGYDGTITLWNRFFEYRPSLFLGDAGSQTDRRANIIIEELMHLSNAMPANHQTPNGTNDEGGDAAADKAFRYWSALIRQACQPGTSQDGVAAAIAAGR